MSLQLYNTLTRRKDVFRPIDARNVRMYVCGPTVYDYAHIGNARPAIVFDLLFRLLRHVYGEAHVTYVRNITDVDDKINARAAEEGVSIRDLTERTAAQYHADLKALNCLAPTIEPRATEHIGQMKQMIETLVEKGCAYVAENHVLFAVGSMQDYGRLSGRSLDEMLAGARVDVAPYKRDPMDFVLWKPSKPGEPGWQSPCGIEVEGRPGWHIECSAMSEAHLGQTFDIHGGGIDLTFPHHENELAQSRCAHGTDAMANVWMHNGFLQVEGRKMSKSEGNFITIHQLLETETFGGRKWAGDVLRLAMLMTHYREPIDFSVRKLEQAETMLAGWRRTLAEFEGVAPDMAAGFIDILSDDLNTPQAITWMHECAGSAREGEGARGAAHLLAAGDLLGVGLRISNEISDAARTLVEERLALIRDKNWAEADRIRDALREQGIQLKDGKDPVTGERVTTWEVIQ